MLCSHGSHVCQVSPSGAHRESCQDGDVSTTSSEKWTGWGFKRADLTSQDGSWPQEAIEGVYNKNGMISYPNFKAAFTVWMLGKAHRYLNDLKAKRG